MSPRFKALSSTTPRPRKTSCRAEPSPSLLPKRMRRALRLAGNGRSDAELPPRQNEKSSWPRPSNTRWATPPGWTKAAGPALPARSNPSNWISASGLLSSKTNPTAETRERLGFASPPVSTNPPASRRTGRHAMRGQSNESVPLKGRGFSRSIAWASFLSETNQFPVASSKRSRTDFL